MQLIGMLDSPYVRRVAVTMQLLGLHFTHQSVSVFSGFSQFQQINPVVKAPTLICDDGEILVDSTLIIDYAEAIADPHKSLMPSTLAERRQALRIIGLALVACEKSVQIAYELNLRPAEKRHEPWVTRITGQLLASYDALESELAQSPRAITRESIDQAGVTVAIAWHFTQRMLPGVVPAEHYPALSQFSSHAEALPEFRAAPYGPDTYPHSS
jgi:glutathione S-transferase